jgi:hypothetical protein
VKEVLQNAKALLEIATKIGPEPAIDIPALKAGLNALKAGLNALKNGHANQLIEGDTMLVPILFKDGRMVHAHLRLPHTIGGEYSSTWFQVKAVSNRVAYNAAPRVVLDVNSASDKSE